MKKIFQFIFILSFYFVSVNTSGLFAQVDLTELEIVDSIRTNYIRTVEFRNTADEFSMPILKHGLGRLVFEFDDSYGEYIDYYYTIRHCDKDWNYTEDVEISEYLDGQEDLQIENFASPVNTQLNYVHYSFSFPNEDIQLRWTGNYLLVVYDDEGTIAITRRFQVVNSLVGIFPKNQSPRVSGTYNTHQAFSVKLNTSRLNAANPTEEFFLTAYQNRFNEKYIPYRQPMIRRGDELEFNMMDQFQFPGLKEYRFFDVRNVLIARENVQHIDISDDHILVLLELDKKRDDKPYHFKTENNGAFILRNEDHHIGGKDITSEYPHVLFTLKSSFPEYGEVYVIGEFTDFKIHPDFKMEYLEVRKSYSLEVPLKQGFYNYLYALKKPNGELDFLKLEGSSFETENDYYFFVYYRPRGGKYDQIVGYNHYQHNYR